MQLNSTAQGAAYRQSTTRYYPEEPIGIYTHTHTHMIHTWTSGKSSESGKRGTDIVYNLPLRLRETCIYLLLPSTWLKLN